MDKYKSCSCFNEATPCGPYKRDQSIDEILKVSMLDKDVSNHIKQLKVQAKKVDIDEWSERKLIENRLGRSLGEEESLCSLHRFKYGIGWKQQKTCKHPQHPNEAGKKAFAGRTVPVTLLSTVCKKYQVNIPLGSLFCFPHLKLEQQSVAEKKTQPIEEEEVVFQENQQDAPYEPDEPVIDESLIDMSIERGDTITALIGSSPHSFRVKRKVSELETSTKDKLRAKFKRMENKMKIAIAESIVHQGKGNVY